MNTITRLYTALPAIALVALLAFFIRYVENKETRAIVQPSAQTSKAGIIAGGHPAPDSITQAQQSGSLPNALQWFEQGKPGLLQLPGLTLESYPDAMKESKLLVGKVLKNDELPPLGELVNVTKQEGGYRLLPHGKHFQKEAKLRIGYDPALVPEGYSPRDIRTYFYDTQCAAWVELPLDTILTNEEIIVSRTDHFTDFINGIIQAPETTKTTSHESNSIKDLEAQKAGANIDVMEPPKANSMGTPRLSLPIRFPAPRNGVGPRASFDFALGSGNGSCMSSTAAGYRG